MRHAILSLLILSMSLQGCVVAAVAGVAAVAAGTYGAVKYFENEAQEDYPAELQVVHEAARDVMAEQGYGDPRKVSEGNTEVELAYENAWLAIERHAGDFTRVRVRVGTFESDDHKRQAALVLEAIRARVS
ncbi:MAG: DUF3568 family protein [Planctomycetota bacterium]